MAAGLVNSAAAPAVPHLTGPTGHTRPRGLVHQVPVDLVGDDDQVVFLRHPAEVAYRRGAGQGAGGVVRQGQDHRTDLVALGPRRADRDPEPGGVGHAAFAGPDVHEPGARADQAGLRRVTDPAGPGHSHVPADGQHQPEQQGLAARAAHDRVRIGAQPAPFPVTGRRLAQRGLAGDRSVAGLAGGPGQRAPQRRMGGQSRLTEGQRQYWFAPALARGHQLVGGQGGGDRDRGRAYRGREDGGHDGRRHEEELLAAGNTGGQPSWAATLPLRPTVTATSRFPKSYRFQASAQAQISEAEHKVF